MTRRPGGWPLRHGLASIRSTRRDVVTHRPRLGGVSQGEREDLRGDSWVAALPTAPVERVRRPTCARRQREHDPVAPRLPPLEHRAGPSMNLSSCGRADRTLTQRRKNSHRDDGSRLTSPCGIGMLPQRRAVPRAETPRSDRGLPCAAHGVRTVVARSSPDVSSARILGPTLNSGFQASVSTPAIDL